MQDVPEGYQRWDDGDAFETLIGPFLCRREADGAFTSLLQTDERHNNNAGTLHGGLIMSFADFSLFVIARDILNGPCVTLSMTCDFVAGVPGGATVIGSGEVTKSTRSLIFVRGDLKVDDTIIAPFSGILKRIKGPGIPAPGQ